MATTAPQSDPLLKGGIDSDTEYSNKTSDLRSSDRSPHSIIKSRKFAPMWNWRWEILGFLGTILAIVAIIIVLVHYNRKPSPSWPYQITLNTLVSVFSTLLKAMMMFAVAECEFLFRNQGLVTDTNQGISQLKWIWFKKPRSLTDLTVFENASRGPWGSICLLFKLKFQ